MDRGAERQQGQTRQTLTEIIGCVERHHIIPKCCGGTNCRSNLVFLTPTEHYIAHRLLVNIYPDTIGLLAAVMFFLNTEIAKAIQL
jgi:hypothetical protein